MGKVANLLIKRMASSKNRISAEDPFGRKMVQTKKQEPTEKFEQKSARVAVLGATSATGQALALLLKHNPLISQLYLYDNSSTVGLAADLRHVDTRSEVVGYVGKDLNLAIRNADIIVLLGVEKVSKDIVTGTKVKSEGPRLIQYAKACCTYAPKAVLLDCVPPVSVSLPLISEVYRRNHWYHPGRVVGSVALLQIRLNTLLARYQDLDPSSVHVPLLGGPDEDTIIPLFTRAQPSPLPVAQANVLINRFRKVDDDADAHTKPNVQPEYCPQGNAFALNRFVTTIALGLLGDSSALCTAHVRSNFVSNCRHIVSTIKFGNTGVVHNYGVPRLTQFELQLFESVCLELDKREQFARDYLDMVTNSSNPVELDNSAQAEKTFYPEKKISEVK